MVQIHSDSFVSSGEKTSKFELTSGKIYKFIWMVDFSANEISGRSNKLHLSDIIE